MKHSLLAFFTVLSSFGLTAQTNLITNSSFNSQPYFDSWTSTSGSNLWAGVGTCGGNTGPGYCWMADQNETMGIHNVNDNLYQNITFPANTVSCTLYIDASINTNETTTTQVYDLIEFSLETTGGSFLASLGYVSNLQGDQGLGSCQPWDSYFSVIPNASNYAGQTARLRMDFISDGSVETILRIDDIEVIAQGPCSYNVSSSFYTLPSADAGTFPGISSVTTNSGCFWDAQVTSGNSWLSTTSSGTGSGNIDITVTANPSLTMRTGSIDVEGNTITVEQPGKECDYSIGLDTFNCPNYKGENYTNITIVTADDGCSWNADVIQGAEWLICNSTGVGSSTINISVTENTTTEERIAQIDVEGETLTVVQPVDFRITGIAESGLQEVKAIPNPFKDRIQLNLNENWMNASVNLYNQLGAIVYSGTVTDVNASIDLKNLDSGTYFLQVESGESRFTEKLIKL